MTIESQQDVENSEHIHRVTELLCSTKARGLGPRLAIARAILDKKKGEHRTHQRNSHWQLVYGLAHRRLVVTAYAGGDTKAEALAAGAWQILSKPVDFPKLLGFVDEALGQPLVMVVDDDHDLCENLWDLLRERGYRVCLAHDEKEAAERLTGREFKVVLIDMKLPAGDGTTVFRIVRGRT